MSDHNDLPDAIKAYAADVRDLLGLQAWEIVIKVVDEIDGEPETGGLCTANEPYFIAEILLRRNLPADKVRETVMHEMLHIAMSTYDLAADYVKDMVPFKHQSNAARILTNAKERVVSALAKALVKGIKPPATETPTP